MILPEWWLKETEGRVARGSTLLDEALPGWRARVHVELLEMQDPDRCVAGQAMTPVEEITTDSGWARFCREHLSLTDLDLPAPMAATDDSIDCGFMVSWLEARDVAIGLPDTVRVAADLPEIAGTPTSFVVEVMYAALTAMWVKEIGTHDD